MNESDYKGVEYGSDSITIGMVDENHVLPLMILIYSLLMLKYYYLISVWACMLL